MSGREVRSWRRTGGILAGVVLVAATSVGCGGGGDDAVDALCADLTALSGSVISLSGSGETPFEELTADLQNVQTAAAAVKESTADLSQEVRDDLSDAVDAYRQALVAIPSQTPLADAPEAIAEAGDDLQEAYDAVVSELNCT